MSENSSLNYISFYLMVVFFLNSVAFLGSYSFI